MTAFFRIMHLSKGQKASIKENLPSRKTLSVAGPSNSPDISLIENLWWKLKKVVHVEAPACKGRESWIDEENWLSLSSCFKEFKLL